MLCYVTNNFLGALGPGRSYSPGQLYGSLLWFFLIGPVVVLLTYLLSRRWQVFRFVSWPVIFGGMSLVPPATGINFSSWWAVNVIFNGIIKRRAPAWWSKYSRFLFTRAGSVISCSHYVDYVCSAALDSGVAVSLVVVFLCLVLPGIRLTWWGNTVYETTADGLGTPWKSVPLGGIFGPPKGSWY